MDYIKYNYKGNKPVKIVLLGDIHYGSGQCNELLFMKAINKIKKDKNIKVILMGDMIENSNRFSVGSGVYDQKQSPTSQIDDLINILKPIQNKILFYHCGNHERRTYTMTGVNPGKLIAGTLTVPYIDNMALTDILVGKQSYRLFTWHGAGSAQTTAGRVKVLERQAETFSADLYAQGHNHDLFSTTIPFREIVNNTFRDIFRHFVLTGSFVKWDSSYAEMNGYKMMKLGCPIITLNNKQKEIKVDLEFI
jgi:predicted phosphodiesterase